ncbi:Epoxidase subunit a [Mycena indigotica]|uniref:Epoxidase subunit a n=1 Tax=Mycena indigotica TaxID=2126181 RepID=A0A8H6SQG2_9AGAR|nr:Epoxidase subunit a [Mycena indigotica]KAF7303928.1 Epoxidase subunit a [Mycena indigotica]
MRSSPVCLASTTAVAVISNHSSQQGSERYYDSFCSRPSSSGLQTTNLAGNTDGSTKKCTGRLATEPAYRASYQQRNMGPSENGDTVKAKTDVEGGIMHNFQNFAQKSTPFLTQKQQEFYAQNGFIVLDSLSPKFADDMSAWTDEIKTAPRKPTTYLHYEELDQQGNRTLSSTEDYARHHMGFNTLFRGESMREFLHRLLGEEMLLFKEKINYKAPRSGGFKPHTDAPAYITIPNIGHVAAVMIAVDAQTAENGCLEVVAGTHKLHSNIPVGQDHCLDADWIATQTWIPLYLERGQIVVFDSHLAHRSGENQTDKGRAAIFATYNALNGAGDQHQAYYVDRRKLWPATEDRLPGEDYAEGAAIFGFGSPMLSVDTVYKQMGL